MDINHARVQARDIAFVFSNVKNYEQLAAAFRPDVEVHVLDASQDGLAQIAAILDGRSGIGALHVVGHGADGALNLGSVTLDAHNLGDYRDVLGQIGGALTDDGDVLLYGCDVAADAFGAKFVGLLAQATGADIAASTDATGSAARGGDWTLEFSQGQVASTNALDLAAVRSLDTLLALPANGVVNISDNDTGSAGSVILVDGGLFKMTATKNLVTDPDPVDGVFLTAGTADETITISADSAQFTSFDLTGMNWVKFFDGVTYDGAYTFNITGYKVGGGTVTTSFSTVDTSPAYTTGDYSQFTNITKFDIRIITTSAGDKPSANTFDYFSIANADNLPTFVDPSTATANVAQNGTAFNLKTLLNASDADPGQTLTWTQGTGPAHGTLNISGATASSGTNVAPGGTITYTPTAGFAGEDTFTITVSDGIRTATKTLTMLVKPAPPSTPDLAAGSDTGTSSIDNVTNATSLSLSGTGTAGDSTTKVRVFIDQNNNGAYDTGEANVVTTMNNGSWTVSGLSTSGLADSTYNVIAQSEVSTSGGTLVNVGAGLPVAIDRTAPTVSISSDKTTLKAGETALVTLTFSEDPGNSLTLADIVATGGTMSALSATGATRTVTFTPNANTNSGTASITLAGSAYTDAAGNSGSNGSAPSITFDTLKPSVTITSDVSTLKIGQTAQITFTFTEDPGSSFDGTDIAVSGGTLGALSGSGTTRTATFTPTAGVNGGTASITVAGGAFTDTAGNSNNAAATPSLAFDTLAPGAATITITTGSDNGFSHTDGLTNDTTPTLTGTAEAGATVTLYDTDGTTVIGSGTATGGTWTITTTDLGVGAHTITAKVTDTAGNTGAASSPLALDIDTTKPTVAISSDASSLSAGETAHITFTFSEDPGDTFTLGDIAVSGGTLGALSGSGNTRTALFTPTDNSTGTASITVTANSYTDAAGNLGGAGATPSITYDTTVPSVTIASDVATLKIGQTATITFTFSQDPGATFTLDDVTTLGGTLGGLAGTGNTRTAVFTPAAGTNNGTASITVVAGSYTDAASHAGLGATFSSLTFDTLAPAAPGSLAVDAGSDKGFSSTDGLTNDATPTLTGTAEDGATVTLYDTNGTTVIGTGTASGGTWTITTGSLSAGAHTVTAKATDAAGNAGAVSAPLEVTVDTAAPTLAITSDATSLKAGQAATITFTFSEDPGSTFDIGDVTVSHGTLGEITGTGSVRTAVFTPDSGFEGSASISVNSGAYTDAAGNDGGAAATPALSVDTKAPTVTVTSDQSALKAGQSANITFTFSEDPGSSFGGYDVVTSGGTLSAISGSGTVRTAVFTPNDATNGGIASITVKAAGYQDVAGNDGLAGASPSLTFDTLAPTVSISSDKAQLKAGETAAITFTFSEDPGAGFTAGDITVSRGSITSLSGAGTTRTAVFTPTANVNAGSASISIDPGKYTDAAGNAGGAGAAVALTYDTLAPGAPGTPSLATADDSGVSHADGITSATTQTFSGAAEDGTTVTLYDGAVAVDSITASGGTWSITTSLGEGTHTLTAIAADTAGNASPASAPSTVIVDRTAPTLAITSSTSAVKAGGTAIITFTFSEDPGNTFVWDGSAGDLTVTGGTLSALSGSGSVRTATFTPTAGVTSGTATITVDAGAWSDAAGNTAGASASPVISIDTVAPTLAISTDATQLRAGQETTVTFTFSEDPGVSFTLADVSATGGTLGSLGGSGTVRTAVFTPASNYEGSGSITVAADTYTDAAGNNGSAAASATLAIHTVIPAAPSVPDLAASDDKGVSDTDNITNTTTPTFSGTAPAGATVKLYDGDTEVGSTVAAGGNWTIPVNLAAGAHSLKAVTIDAYGNASAASAALAVTVDTAAPTVVITSDHTTLAAGQEATITFTFSEAPAGSFTISDIDATGGTLSNFAGSGTVYTVKFTPLSNTETGSGSVTLQPGSYTDTAGNDGASGTFGFTYDTAIPAAPSKPLLSTLNDSGAVHDDGVTKDETLVFTGSAEAGATVTLVNAANGAQLGVPVTATGGSWTITLTGLPEGEVDVAAIATDASGNTSPKSVATHVTVDRTPPAALSLALVDDTGTGGDGITSNGHIQVSGIEGSNAWEYSLNGGTSWTTGSGTELQLPGDGMYSVMARQVDLAGNNSAASAALAVQFDATAPHAAVTLDHTVLARGQTSQVTVDFGEAVTGFDGTHVTPENGTLGAFSSADGGRTWTATFTPAADVSDATNVITVSNVGVSDAAGNAGTGTSSSPNYQVQTAAPVAVIEMSDTHLLAGETSLVTIRFGQVVNGFTLADLHAESGTLSGLATSDGGATWTATFTPSANLDDTTNVITVANTGVTSQGGDAGVGTSDSVNYEVLTVRPTASINVAQMFLAPGAQTNVTITFSEAVTGFDNADLAVTNATLSPVASTDGGKTWTATLTAGTNVSGVTGRVTLNLPGVQDLDGNAGTGTVASGPYTVGPLTPPGGGDTITGGLPKVELITDPATGQLAQLITVPLAPANGTAQVGLGTAIASGGNTLTVALPGGVGLKATGAVHALDNATGLQDLIARINGSTTPGTTTQTQMKGLGTEFINSLGTGVALESKTVVMTVGAAVGTDKPVVISGTAAAPGANSPAVGLVIDAHNLPQGAVLQLDNIDFAAVIGSVRLFGGEGRNMVIGDGASQVIYLGPDDDVLNGGAGDDFIGSAGGNDTLDGGDGNDLVAGGIGNDMVLGGAGNDVLQGGRSTTGNWDFYVSATGAITARHSGAVFTQSGSEMVQGSELDARVAELGFLKADPQQLAGIALLYDALGRTPDLGGLSFWSRPGISLNDVAKGVLGSAEFFNGPLGQSTDEAYLRGVYQQVLGRGPDASGLAWWLARLAGSDGHPAASRIDVLTAVALSSENKTQALGADGYKIGAASVKESAWFAGSGDDLLNGGAGNDVLVGGDGFDTAVYTGKQADYRILVGADHQLRVVQTASGDVDTLSGIEAARFDDCDIDLAFMNSDPALVTELGMLYQAVLDRAGDAGGFGFWLSHGLNGQQLVQAFTQSAEFQSHFAGMSDNAFVHALYANSGLASTAAGGEASWQAYLGTHTRAQLVAAWIAQDDVVHAQFGTAGLWLV